MYYKTKLGLTICLTVLFTISFSSCKKKGCTDVDALNYNEEAKKDDGSCAYPDSVGPILPTTDVMGFGILEKLPGIWNGPVSSPTPIGSFPEWIVDFRPISASQVSAKNELDSVNDIFMSFFIVKFENAYKVGFRNGGGFNGNIRNSYMLIDSVSETGSHSFYRFSDPISGGDRVYTNVTFKDDSLIMHTFTNKFNTLSEPETHMLWQSKLKDHTSTENAISHFNYPKKEVTIDFSTTFDGVTETVFYSIESDPYPENEQPYLGISNVAINITNPTTVDPTKKVLILISSQPLFSGTTYIPENKKYLSRYVFTGALEETGFDFNYMHPGTYYVNAIYDSNGDFNISSGDFMNYPFDKSFTLESKGTGSVSVPIAFEIP